MVTSDLLPRIAVLGSGGWGRNHVRTWFELGALALVCDPDQNRLDAIADSIPGIESSTDPAAALARDDIDAVVLATPVPTHHELAMAALYAGKDVLVEKPLALDLPSALAMVETAERLGRVLAVGHVLEYHPAVEALHELLRDRVLGNLRWLYSNRLNLGRVRTAEDVLWSFATHDIAMILRIVGRDPDVVSCRGGAYLSPGIADTTFTSLSFPGGVEAEVFVSWLHPFKEHRLVVVGEEASAVFDDTAETARKLVIYPYAVDWSDPAAPMTTREEVCPVPIGTTAPLIAECMHFLDRIIDRAPPIADGRSGLRALRVLEAARRSMAGRGAPIQLDVHGAGM